jgi:hypothetical protein
LGPAEGTGEGDGKGGIVRRSWTQEWAVYYKNALFVITGFIPYYIFFGLPAALLTRYLCGPEPPPASSPCGIVIIVLAVIAILALPIGIAQWYQTGKWIWTDLLHVFAENV